MRYTADDIEVFFLPVFVGMTLSAGLGVAAIFRRRGLVWRWTGYAAAALVVAAPAVAHFDQRDLRRVTAASDYGLDILDTLPRGAALIVETDDAFVLVYHTLVMGRRQDLRIYHRDGHFFRRLWEEIRVPRVPGEPWLAWRTRVEQAFIDRELARIGSPGVWFLGWPGYEAPPAYRLEPVGLLYRIVRADAPPLDADAVWAAYREPRVRAQAERIGDGFGLVVAATYPMARGERALQEGDRARARADFEEACRVAPWVEPVRNYIGTVYGRFGMLEDAITMFQRAVEAKPTSVRAWNNLGKARLLGGDPEGARRAWTRSLAVMPDQSDVVESLRALERAPDRR
jgi:hypothetical protein